MTPATAIFHQAALNGYKPYEFIDKILTFAFQKKQKEAIEIIPIASVMEPEVVIAEPQPFHPLGVPAEAAPQPNFTQQMQDRFRQATSASPFSFELLWENVKRIAHEVWLFIKSPIFLKNFAAWLLFVFGLFFLVSFTLRIYTRHNESVQVGNYEGMTLEEAMRRARDRGFRIVVIDSVYRVDKQPNTILDQDPKPFSRVKQRRRIYLTITKYTPDQKTLPSLVGSYDYNQYIKKLPGIGMRYAIKERVFDAKLEPNTILYFYINNRKITDEMLKSGVEVPMGSLLEFVVTERSADFVEIPNLVCQTYKAASFLISTNNLATGQIFGEVTDIENAYVWKQEPEYVPGQNIRMGEQINLYLVQERPESCPAEEQTPNENFDNN
jgi:UDP-N-acetylmuramate--alanine ligase